MAFRKDTDTLGEVSVPFDALWQAQTQRSLMNFPFDVEERQPKEMIRAMALIKEACAMANKESEKLDASLADAIIDAARQIRREEMYGSFPLTVFQTGSGTQTNMNMNEVIASMANDQLLKKRHAGESGIGKKSPVHPNDHVNMGQSSNDVYPSAVTIATLLALGGLIDTLERLIAELERIIVDAGDDIKVGRTHLMDAVPMKVADEVSGWSYGLQYSLSLLKNMIPFSNKLALGGTAVGTGLSSYKGFDQSVADYINLILKQEEPVTERAGARSGSEHSCSTSTGVASVTDGCVGLGLQRSRNYFEPSPNKFFSLSQVTPSVAMAGCLTTLATTLCKMANDIRLLSSGPRTGLAEIVLPANEPGSSIMPGKVNPTQCESLTMVCLQVMANSNAVMSSNIFGHLQLNVFLPLVASNQLRSIRLLTQAMTNFTKNALRGMRFNTKNSSKHVDNSLMLITALAPVIGYDQAAATAKKAYNENITLKEACLALGYLKDGTEYDKFVIPSKMARPF